MRRGPQSIVQPANRPQTSRTASSRRVPSYTACVLITAVYSFARATSATPNNRKLSSDVCEAHIQSAMCVEHGTRAPRRASDPTTPHTHRRTHTHRNVEYRLLCSHRREEVAAMSGQRAGEVHRVPCGARVRRRFIVVMQSELHHGVVTHRMLRPKTVQHGPSHSHTLPPSLPHSLSESQAHRPTHQVDVGHVHGAPQLQLRRCVLPHELGTVQVLYVRRLRVERVVDLVRDVPAPPALRYRLALVHVHEQHREERRRIVAAADRGCRTAL
jgi:hypothetical protein